MPFFISGKSKCVLCGAVLDERQELFGTMPFIEDRSHRLWRFHDAVMHRSCFLDWPDREEFISLFNDYYDKHLRGMRLMHPDGTVEEREPRPGRTA